MRKLLAFLLLLAAFGVHAAPGRITLTVTVTNTAATTNTFTINATTRIWTNAHSSGTILTNLTGKNASATNLWDNFSRYPIGSGITHEMTGTNVIRFVAPFGAALSGSSAGNWATTILSTQSGPNTFTALWPIENMVGETNRTNQGSSLVYGLSTYSTNAFATNSTALSNHITKGASPPQSIASELRLAGNLNNGTSNLSVSNLVNSGNAIRSGGSGGNSLQVGSNAVASGSMSMAIGNGSIADSANALALGIDAIATNAASVVVGKGARSLGGSSIAVGETATAYYEGVSIGAGTESGPAGVAIGAGAITQATNAVAIGAASGATKDTSTALGYGATSEYTNSTAIGAGAVATAVYQVRVGTSTETVSIPGMLHVSGTITNATMRGTNIINAQEVYTPTSNTGLANGYNSAVALAAAYVRYSGPTAAYTNVGFSAANKMDGRRHLLQFDNPGLSFTILHDSGLDAGPTNRVYTGTGALVNSTNNPVFVEIVRDEVVDRWRILWIR